jgi:hypothetical protein
MRCGNELLPAQLPGLSVCSMCESEIREMDKAACSQAKWWADIARDMIVGKTP